MECTWDAALWQLASQLPPELLHAIQHDRNKQYLESITRASLDPRYTYVLFAHCEPIFAHVCANLQAYGSLASSVATLGRIALHAPYLASYATHLLQDERLNFTEAGDDDELMLYLLGLFRLLRFDHTTFRPYVRVAHVEALLSHRSRPVVYLAIRILQIVLDGADHWFEQMIEKYLGEDNPTDDIDGRWDGQIIDYRFLSLWEDHCFETVSKLISEARLSPSPTSDSPRIIPEADFHPSAALLGNILLPRTAQRSQREILVSDALVSTPTITCNAKNIANALKSTRPLLLTGLAGSGKTLLIRHAARRLGKLDKMVTLHLNEQSDAKLLIGVHSTGDVPGSFVWRPGILTTAVQEGRWVLIEDLDRAPTEIIGTLLPLIESGELSIPSRKQTIHVAQGFRILATIRTQLNYRGEESKPAAHMLGARHWHAVHVGMPPNVEQQQIASALFPMLRDLLPQFMAVFIHAETARQRAASTGQSKTGILRSVAPRDLLKWCRRVECLLRHRSTFTSSDMDSIFVEAIDCFAGALPDGPVRIAMAASIAEELRIDPQRRDYLLRDRDVGYDVGKSKVTIGRYSFPRPPLKRAGALQTDFCTNPHTNRMLEKVAAAVVNREPLILVGETGVGKTAAVQYLALQVGKRLEPFNLSQQSEAGDLLGGFKPVTPRSLMVPMGNEFDELFHSSFSPSRNHQFLQLLGKQMAKSNWKAVCKLWQQALNMVEQRRNDALARSGEAPSKKRKVDSVSLDFSRWATFADKVSDMERRLSTGPESFAFSFVEGNIVRAVRNGDWVLLDEINLASPDTLEALADLLDSDAPSLLLTEAGNVERIEAHPEFRIFAAMNPATDVGKKDLPPGIRSRFTELYVDSPDRDIKSLQAIVKSYLRSEVSADQSLALDISTLYQHIIGLAELNKLVDGAGQKPHFSLRTLTRTLAYAKHIAPQCNVRRALYEGFQMSFLTFLDTESSGLIQLLLEQHLFGKRTNIRAELQKALRKPNDEHHYVQGWPESKHWMRKGDLELNDQPNYILTPFVRRNLENLVRATSTRRFPVLIQGPTSSGKTSMIEYLANRTGHKFVRINNHEHTGLQEYLGTYASGLDGRLHFQEGLLVRALREGHWVVLDELNLAPTDVLEALNRLLDDNRELLIPETQETVRPHANFMLFATQNPAGLYGGRKTLSRAFRNRFLELHFDDIPVDELQEILHRRTQQPESRCKRIVAVYRELSVLRQESRLFERQSFATLRDLFRWAMRQNDTIEQLAANGFMLLAERVRKPEERQALKEIIERVMSLKGPRVSIDESLIYADTVPEVQNYKQSVMQQGIVWTKAMRRLYVLVSRAIANNEPVLLVGQTGCGKTTVCQMLADAFGQQLHTVNAHQNTETGDLIGSQRPIRNRALVGTELRQMLLASALLLDLDKAVARTTDDLLSTYDQAVSSLAKEKRTGHSNSDEHRTIQAARSRYNALFEWQDGSLVQAMKDGAFFLLDEISLADDSVLERMNSVLESQRSILLAEKGSLDSFVIAASGFQFFATMNPGGDYGKRELSPALRNRFTEIWVPPLSDTEDIVLIAETKLMSNAKAYAHAIVAFAQWFNYRYNTSASSSISVRDVLTWVAFINAFPRTDIMMAVVHGAAMTYIDALGANPAGLMTTKGSDLALERTSCFAELSRLIGVGSSELYSSPTQVVHGPDFFAIGPYQLRIRSDSNSVTDTFTFEAPTTLLNAMRVVRALTLQKPILLEGSPGVGKTALVTAIAGATGMPLTRINLSEQTDLMDLFGSDAPVEGAVTGTFSWRDAPFLRALKTGEWVLLDEMNLASQSILEGLNACLDHRGEVFVPELGQAFVRHPDFRLFAAQNPHSQGGGRKGLPASFVNRFTVVYADAFRPEDLRLICHRSFPDVDTLLIAQIVNFVSQLESVVLRDRHFGANGGPWEFNLRDISRWLTLTATERGLLKAGTARDFVGFLFSQRFRTPSDRSAVDDLISSVFQDTLPACDSFFSISSRSFQLGLAVLRRDLFTSVVADFNPSQALAKIPMKVAQSAMLCIQLNWPVVLVGQSGAGKSLLVKHLAGLIGASVEVIAMNAETDAMDLIGGYEQANPSRHAREAIEAFRVHWARAVKSGLLRILPTQVADLQPLLGQEVPDFVADLPRISEAVRRLPSELSEVLTQTLQRVQQAMTALDNARFEWVDGLLIEAMQQGRWLILDNANLCSAAVLDRLNSLLEPHGALTINEHTKSNGAPRIIDPHPDFRIFLTMDPRYGELSRAMRNRAVELFLPDEHNEITSHGLPQPASSMARFHEMNVVKATSLGSQPPVNGWDVISDHMAIQDQRLIARMNTQLRKGLYDTSHPSLQLSVSQQTRDRPRVEDFYMSVLGDPHVSADLASVQTLHPLNNQALLCGNENALLRASTLAFISDSARRLQTLVAFISDLRSNQTVIQQLPKIERSLSTNHKSIVPRPSFLAVAGTLLVQTKGYLSSIEVPGPRELSGLKLDTFRFLASWSCLLRALQASRVNQALLSTSLNLITTSAVGASSLSSQLIGAARDALANFMPSASNSRGRACSLLWSVLKGLNPASVDRLESILSFEKNVDHFDQVCRRFHLPFQEMVGLRVSFAQALSVMAEGATDLQQLSQRLDEMLSSVSGDEYGASEDFAKPNFTAIFETFCRRLALETADGNTTSPSETSALEVLAQRATKTSIEMVKETHSAAQLFRLLGCTLPQQYGTLSVEIVDPDWCGELLDRAACATSVNLKSLDLFDSECTILGHSLATSAHVFSSDGLPALDFLLERLCTAVLRGLSSESQDFELITMAVNALSRLAGEQDVAPMAVGREESSAKSDSSFASIEQAFRTVIGYLRKPAAEGRKRLIHAADAWATFAIACLTLYIPDQPFDPTMKLQIEHEAYHEMQVTLSGEHHALRTWRKALTGAEDSLRARIIQDDLSSLGPKPETIQICRPAISTLDVVQGEFDALMRAVRSLSRGVSGVDDEHNGGNDTFWTNLINLRQRLCDQNRAYADLTMPVVGFIDCLRTARSLREQAASKLHDTGPVIDLARLTPLISGSLNNWTSDDMFIQVLSANLDRRQAAFGLAIFAARCAIRPITAASPKLRDIVEERFMWFYQQWKTVLREDQRKALAKSSLYRFKGDDGLDDDAMNEEMVRMFPTDRVQPPEDAEGQSAHSDTRDATSKIARLHHVIFREQQPLTGPSLGQLLSQFASIARSSRSVADHENLMALAMHTVYGLSHGHDVGPSYNIYTDSNVVQVRRLRATLKQVAARFTSLHQAWPEHASPVEVLRSCDELLRFGHRDSLMNYLPACERLFASIAQWQQVASKEYSAQGVLDGLTDLLVSWRQLELSSWAGLLDRELSTCAEVAASWWYIAYENIIVASTAMQGLPSDFRHHLEELLKTIDNFLINCGIGEFVSRIALLQDFAAHLAVAGQSGPSLRVLEEALRNLIAYRQCFVPVIMDRLTKGRSDLEKEIRNVIQVASWKDRNIDILKSSAKASHKKLLRLVRKFRALLAEPAASIIQSGIPHNYFETQTASCRNFKDGKAARDDDQITSMLQASSWQQRPGRYINVATTARMINTKTQDAIAEIDAAQRIEAFGGELTLAITELQKATPTQMTEATKPIVQHLKTRKRRLVADILKDVRLMGFQISLSEDLLSRQASSLTVLSSCAMLPLTLGVPHVKLANHQFYRLLDIMPTVRECAQKHSSDLTPAETSRSLSLLESMFFLVIRQRETLSRHLQEVETLTTVCSKFDTFVEAIEPTASIDQINPDSAIAERQGCLFAVVDQTQTLIQAQSELAGKDYSHAIDGLRQLSLRLASMIHELSALPVLPNGITDRVRNESKADFQDLVDGVISLIDEASQADPELMPILSQMQRWTSTEGSLQHHTTNDVSSVCGDQWVTDLLQLLDRMLSVVQSFGLPTHDDRSEEKNWLLRQNDILSSRARGLRLTTITRAMSALLQKLSAVQSVHGVKMEDLAAVGRCVRPIVAAFILASEDLASQFLHTHEQTAGLALQLATSFNQLAREGFCTPPEKSDGKDTSAGEVETGTGLGDGEGGEDISKDVGDNEDLSDLAQEANVDAGRDQLEDEKDAVDMADEEMEGEMGDAVNEDEGEGGDQQDEQQEEIDEEVGDVDDLGASTLDDKMWDDGKNQDQADREVNDAKGTAKEQDLAAADGSKSGDDRLDEAEAPAEAEENVQADRKDLEQIDPHAQEQDTLELPDDITMDDERGPDEKDSDLDSLSDHNMSEPAKDEDAASHDETGDAAEYDAQGSPDIDSASDPADEVVHTEEPSEQQQPDDHEDIDPDSQMKELNADGDAVSDDMAHGDDGIGNTDDSSRKPHDSTTQLQGLDDGAEIAPDEDPSTAGPTGGQTSQEANPSSADQEAMPDQQARQSLKQIGDALNEWYRQHRPIQDAKETEDIFNERETGVDLPNADFQHLPDDDAMADTQALGTAEAQQSTAFDQETGLPVNEREIEEQLSFQDEQIEPAQDQMDLLEDDQMAIEPSDTLRPDHASNTFAAKSTDLNGNMDTRDGSEDRQSDTMEDVDEQLLHTHISLDDESRGVSMEEARRLWSSHESSTRNLALILTEHLRLILQPTQATKMRGDFRTGKRLNIKRIIPYIASSYKRDKIWMRRSVPSKRSYQVMLAIDDSKSMNESNSQELAFDTLALVSKAMSMLEVGDLAVVAFGEHVTVAHDFDTPFTSDAGAQVFSQFGFAQSKTNIRKLLAQSIEMFRSARLKATASASDLWQLQLIISDGVCEDHPSIRQLVRQAHEERIMIVFIVVDAAAQNGQAAGVPNQSILDLQTAEFIKDDAGEMQLKMVKYLDTFPFRYYLIVRDLHELPGVLAGALRQWFAEVVEAGS